MLLVELTASPVQITKRRNGTSLSFTPLSPSLSLPLGELQKLPVVTNGPTDRLPHPNGLVIANNNQRERECESSHHMGSIGTHDVIHAYYSLLSHEFQGQVWDPVPLPNNITGGIETICL